MKLYLLRREVVYIEQILFYEICSYLILLRMKTKQISQKTLLAIVTQVTLLIGE